MELIRCDSWAKLADSVYDSPEFTEPKNNSVIYCPLDHIEQFIRQNDNFDSYCIISANSDYGLCYQHQNPVWQDLKKWLDFIPIDETYAYNSLLVPARGNIERCKITDTYSIKMHTFTKSTFSEIPNSIRRWYSTNCNILGGATPIPFGIPDWSYDLISKARSKNRHKETKKDIGVYINFQNNTAERVAIKDKYRKYQGENSPISVKVIEGEISHEEYVENLLRSVYVVSPPGNGLDCFRTLEALYCGAIPLIADNYAAAAYDGLPVVKMTNFGDIEKMVAQFGYKVFHSELEETRADFEYWRNEILKDKE